MLAHAAALAAADQTAHVDLEAGLHEGEEARTHPHRDVPAEYLGEDALDHHLAGGEGEVLVHDEGLILEEGTLVAGIGGLVTVHPAGVHEAIGGLVGLHIPHGAAGEVGTQAELIPALALVVALQPVGVHALTGGVVGGEVQIVEAVQLAGNVGLLKDLEAHGAEGVVEVVAHLGDGVQAPGRRQDAGDGDIEVRRYLGGLQLQLLPPLIQQRRQLGLGLIHRLAHFRPQGGVQLGQFLQQPRQAALLAQQQGLDLLQLRFAADGGDAVLALLQQLCQFFFHVGPPPYRIRFLGRKKPFPPNNLGRKA